MNIVLDAFGGDNAPLEIIKGAIDARKDFEVDITLVGDEEKIKACAKENSLDISSLKIKHAPDVIDICEEATNIIRSKKNCSMAVGMQMVADGEGDAFVSAGSTAALVVGATFIVKRIKGIKRAALASVLPTATNPTMLLDCGANSECRPEMLMQFGIMGSIYMNKVLGVKNPKVALANIGAEETKGRELELGTYALLKDAPVNFVGNIEAREIPKGNCDVVVADGFSGNLLLKLYEGMGKFFSNELKGMLMNGFLSKIGALFLLKKIKAFKKKMDYTEYGGAPLLGTSKPVIKAHGSSNAKAIYNAIRQAKSFSEGDVIGEVTKALAAIKENSKTEQTSNV
ncbi:MAG: phosphate acyltransferase PlsX [Oscillospiraceae bacterium]|nr:phosphate acyltransferase PlsX [Oscillospiraceae bacterium]